jgi:hypothetical protein
MRKGTVWKSLAGAGAIVSVMLAGAGTAGALPSKEPQPGQPGYNAPLNCATAEHAGFGLLYHQVDKDCSGFPS